MRGSTASSSTIHEQNRRRRSEWGDARDAPWRAALAIGAGHRALAAIQPSPAGSGAALDTLARGRRLRPRVVWNDTRRLPDTPHARPPPTPHGERMAIADGSRRSSAARGDRLPFARRCAHALDDAVPQTRSRALHRVRALSRGHGACEQRAIVARAKGTTRALRDCSTTDRDAWPDADRAQWLAMRAEVALANGPIPRTPKCSCARRCASIRPPAPPRGIRLLESLADRAPDSIGPVDLCSPPRPEALRGVRSSAIGRWRQTRPRGAPPTTHWGRARARRPAAHRRACRSRRLRQAEPLDARPTRTEPRHCYANANALRAASLMDSSLAL